MKFIFIKKKWLVFGFLTIVLLVSGWFYLQPQIIPTISTTMSPKEYVIHITTGELKAKTEDGKEIESYFWNPGTVYVPKEEQVTFKIFGVNGTEHSFYIEGTNIKGTVKKGEEITVTANFNEEGMYRIICMNHADLKNNGPMIGYIVVD